MATRRRASKLASAGESSEKTPQNPGNAPGAPAGSVIPARQTPQNAAKNAKTARPRGKVGPLERREIAREFADGKKQIQIAAEHGICHSRVSQIIREPAVRSMILEYTREHAAKLKRAYSNLVNHLDTALDPAKEAKLEQRLEAGDRVVKILESADKAAAKIAELEQAQGAGEGGVLLEDLLLFWAKAREVQG